MAFALAPLYVVTGAPGAGKSTVLPELVRIGEGLIVMDIDELLDDGALLGLPIATQDAAPLWPAYNLLWRRIVDMSRRAGHAVVLLCPLVPAEFDGAGAWALLDCDDRVRTTRLRERGWTSEGIDEALADAKAYRSMFSTVIRTDDATPPRVAERIGEWARSAPTALAPDQGCDVLTNRSSRAAGYPLPGSRR